MAFLPPINFTPKRDSHETINLFKGAFSRLYHRENMKRDRGQNRIEQNRFTTSDRTSYVLQKDLLDKGDEMQDILHEAFGIPPTSSFVDMNTSGTDGLELEVAPKRVSGIEILKKMKNIRNKFGKDPLAKSRKRKWGDVDDVEKMHLAGEQIPQDIQHLAIGPSKQVKIHHQLSIRGHMELWPEHQLDDTTFESEDDIEWVRHGVPGIEIDPQTLECNEAFDEDDDTS
ncbi:hypothetical protein KY290_024944 [Solanum tuberosum]|uniref:Uncharacterized protein n=1 Tax=Solanum tuberosum TaxID=4113 RepID=A0ABQ7UTZ1_SOLTU|nr:hypothetical protein KY284_023799 [Solanum tuberosum]KAH0754674.1 hypothetical protein KY290_024944 [Solanum tuberosum]